MHNDGTNKSFGEPERDPSDPVQSGPDTMRRSLAESEFTRVEAERMDEEPGSPFRTDGVSMLNIAMRPPPVLTAWMTLFAAWLFLGSSVPFTVFIGVPLNLAALVLGAVCLSRGGVFTGVMLFLLGTAGSLIVYLVGLFKFLGSL